jgi:hypothetical protein
MRVHLAEDVGHIEVAFKQIERMDEVQRRAVKKGIEMASYTYRQLMVRLCQEMDVSLSKRRAVSAVPRVV